MLLLWCQQAQVVLGGTDLTSSLIAFRTHGLIWSNRSKRHGMQLAYLSHEKKWQHVMYEMYANI